MSEAELKTEIKDIADYLGCNADELWSEVSKIIQAQKAEWEKDEVHNLEAWRKGFEAGYDQVINEMLYWLVETKRKTVPAEWVTVRQRKFGDELSKEEV